MLISALVRNIFDVHVNFCNCFTGDTVAQTVHHSSRLNKGNGGQVAQLQNIECIQTAPCATSKASHASQLDAATANELTNPMAPTKPKPCLKVALSCA